MKTRFLLVCVMILFAGCRTPKKIATVTIEDVAIREKQNQTNVTESYTFVDTSKKSGFEINYFKVEFYPPDTSININPTVDSMPTPTLTKPNQGALKSIEKITVKANEENVGVTSMVNDNMAEINTEYNADIDTMMETMEQPSPDPYRWRYIFGVCVTILIAGAGVYFGLRKKTNFITTVVSFVRKMFL
ncbi:MAG: hypothetical protein LBD80_01680 [Tannerella sp.]|jgi:hypothetical protein|nr:hypothetical protein [Tannerella sp.]